MKIFGWSIALHLLAGAVCLSTALWIMLDPNYSLRIATGNLALGIFLGAAATLLTMCNHTFFQKQFEAQVREIVQDEFERQRFQKLWQLDRP